MTEFVAFNLKLFSVMVKHSYFADKSSINGKFKKIKDYIKKKMYCM